MRLPPDAVARALGSLAPGSDAESATSSATSSGSVGLAELTHDLGRWLDRRSPVEVRISWSLHWRDGWAVLAAVSADASFARRTLGEALRLAGLSFAQAARVAEPLPVRIRDAAARLLDSTGKPSGLSAQDLMFVRLARRRGIPVCAFEALPRGLLLGQGCRGRLVQAAANDEDSAIGTTIASDKSLTNRMLALLGFPGVVHRLVRDEEAAVRAARRIGFPLVVKPVASGKGTGVVADVRDVDALRDAFRIARRHSPRGVLVERHVPGDDHRVSVFGGRFAWSIARRPARVVGDGRRSVAELIGAENARRASLPARDRPLIEAIEVDDELRGHLAKSGLGLDSVPAGGAVVTLRSIANVSKGGTYEDVTDRVHPDNRAMAEAIAAALRMDALGVDYITTDISRSWREVPGAVIEVNETPGAGTEHYVGIILDRLFPEGAPSRVPYVVVAGDVPDGTLEAMLARLRSEGEVVGLVAPDGCSVDGAPRGTGRGDLSAGMTSVLLDPRVTAVVARLDAAALVSEGILSTPIDRLVLGAGLSADAEALARAHALAVEVVSAR